MRWLGLFFITVISIVSLIGCGTGTNNNNGNSSNSDEKPGMIGYVVGKDEARILVVDPVPQDFSSTGGLSEFYNAISFSNVPSEINIGDKVEVWFDAVAESYPGQSEAKDISVIPSEKPSKADLTEAEAIRKALTSSEAVTNQITVIQSVKFNASTDTWAIQIKQGEQQFNIQVNDTK